MILETSRISHGSIVCNITNKCWKIFFIPSSQNTGSTSVYAPQTWHNIYIRILSHPSRVYLAGGVVGVGDCAVDFISVATKVRAREIAHIHSRTSPSSSSINRHHTPLPPPRQHLRWRYWIPLLLDPHSDGELNSDRYLNIKCIFQVYLRSDVGKLCKVFEL